MYLRKAWSSKHILISNIFVFLQIYLFIVLSIAFVSCLEMEKKVKEERAARDRAENQIVQIEKQCSTLDFDLKQSQQKLEHLTEQKERLEDEVSKTCIFTYHVFYVKDKLKNDSCIKK